MRRSEDRGRNVTRRSTGYSGPIWRTRDRSRPRFRRLLDTRDAKSGTSAWTLYGLEISSRIFRQADHASGLAQTGPPGDLAPSLSILPWLRCARRHAHLQTAFPRVTQGGAA